MCAFHWQCYTLHGDSVVWLRLKAAKHMFPCSMPHPGVLFEAITTVVGARVRGLCIQEPRRAHLVHID